MRIKQKIFNAYSKLKLIASNPYYGFIRGHDHIGGAEIEDIKSLVGNPSGLISKEFEDEFSKYVGLKSVSFAAGRMGFFALLRVLNVEPGDEVIVTGFTCSVMVNAVIRTGATPVYADISKDTLGTSAKSVEKNISSRTKIIVAQHSFGIPCEIEEICEISKKYNIFLLEDCALALDSSVNGKKVGLFGDASLFSLDHSKPINSMIGGMICTKDNDLYIKLKGVQKKSGEISLSKKTALFNRFLLERKYCNPRKYGLFQIIDYMHAVYRVIFNIESPFLMKDSSSSSKIDDEYPYPSRMPEFIAFLALNELKRWPTIKTERRRIMNKYIDRIRLLESTFKIPGSYFKNGVAIIPLRFVFTNPSGVMLKNKMNYFLDMDSAWFNKPIISLTEPIENYGYLECSCPVSESLNTSIINLPTSIAEDELEDLLDLIDVLDYQER